MVFKNNIPFIEIPATKFQDFDHGKIIEMHISETHDLASGDWFYWSCAQFDGIAEVVKRNKKICSIKKIS